jgi:hypothetical protein
MTRQASLDATSVDDIIKEGDKGGYKWHVQ